ncbi:MAG: hypothetical protein IKL27_02390, partial [Oscillospiraceae bacterium]|nr:hypothetical protein [Oscillospiraceae bacterium]
MKKFLSVILSIAMIASMAVVSMAVNTEAALQAALNAGGTVKLTGDVTATNTITVPAGVTVELDLNGHTISMVRESDITKNHEMILNKGDLTIIGEGKISYQYTGAETYNESTYNGYATNTITSEPGSTLTIKGGTIENLTTANKISYAIDGRTNGGLGNVTVNIEGGVITSEKQAIRIFANSTTKVGTLNISDGEISGRVIMHNANSSANTAVLDVTGGTFIANEYSDMALYVYGNSAANAAIDASVSGGSFDGEVYSSVGKAFISGGTFTSTPDPSLIETGYTLVKGENGAGGVAAGNSTDVGSVELTISPASATLVVKQGGENGNEVYNGKATNALTGLPEGDYYYEVSRKGFDTITGTFTIEKGKTASAAAELLPNGAGGYGIYLDGPFLYEADEDVMLNEKEARAADKVFEYGEPVYFLIFDEEEAAPL